VGELGAAGAEKEENMSRENVGTPKE